MNTSKANIALAFAILATSCNAFSVPATTVSRAPSAVIMSMNSQDSEGSAEQSRRSVLSSLLATTVAATMGASVLFPSEAFAEAETLERGGVKLTPFNSLAFNYRGAFNMFYHYSFSSLAANTLLANKLFCG